MATSKGVIQGYAAQAAVDSAHQVIVAADVIGSGSEQAMLLPMMEQSKPYSTPQTMITADAGYHSDANVQHLKDHAIPALIADNQSAIVGGRNIGDHYRIFIKTNIGAISAASFFASVSISALSSTLSSCLS